MLRLESVSKSFGGLKATDNLTLDFQAGSLSAIIGPNGAGKTTVFNLITGRLVPDSGSILLDGESITGLSPARIVERGVARAFQVASVFPTMTVAEQMQAAVLARRRRIHDAWRPFRQAPVVRRADELIELLGLEGRAHVPASQLSHGDQKLLDIGLALALEPRVLLLDEPTAGMGPDERWQMIERVQRLWQAGGMTLVFIEHDMDIVFAHAQTVTVLYYGGLLAQGTPEEIRSNPAVIDAYLGHGFETEAR
ncbi:MAG TPA: ABC transporter ATP-binding protein [Quisquiliibacterium sp.]|jgi:branched-chain amino acid transport system ATP-binding protein|nr:ABC transporter ATP-binding protein [Quisquiliibacterium sp.]